MSSFFQGSSHINAPHGQFSAIGQNQYNIQHAEFTYRTEDDPVLASLKPTRSPYVQPCMPGTRQWIIDKIDDWLDDQDAPNILLLTGSPGAGKSAIASTLVSKLQEAGLLGSNFFCKRDDIALSDPAACWRTIAFDLAQRDPLIAKRVVENIKGRKVDPERADIESHFKYLIEDPLGEVWRSRVGGLPDGTEVGEKLQVRNRETQMAEAYSRVFRLLSSTHWTSVDLTAPNMRNVEIS
jgi:Cdc6-like AAA superfamily ATPase